MDTWYTRQFLSFLVDSFWKTRTTKGNSLPTECAIVVHWRAKLLHVDYIRGRELRCCVHVFLQQSDAANLRNSRLVWDPILAAQTQTRLFLQQRDIKTDLAPQSTRTIYIWNGFHSLSAFKEQPCVMTTCAWVFWGGVSWCRLAAVAWFSRWHMGTSLATSQFPGDMCTCEMDFNLTKTP